MSLDTPDSDSEKSVEDISEVKIFSKENMGWPLASDDIESRKNRVMNVSVNRDLGISSHVLDNFVEIINKDC